MTIPSTVSAALHGTPYPDSHLSDPDRLKLYAGILNADAERSRRYRESKRAVAEMGFKVEAHTGLINLGEAA